MYIVLYNSVYILAESFKILACCLLLAQRIPAASVLACYRLQLQLLIRKHKLVHIYSRCVTALAAAAAPGLAVAAIVVAVVAVAATANTTATVPPPPQQLLPVM